MLDKYEKLGRKPVGKEAKEIAQLWYDNMLKDAKIEQSEAEVAQLWYEVMQMGGM